MSPSTYDRAFRHALYALTVFFSLFQLFFLFLRLPSFSLRALHLAMGSAVIFLSVPLVSPRRLWSSIIDFACAGAALLAGLYYYLNYVPIAQRSGLPTQMDLVVGIITVLIVLEIARRTLGLVLTGIGVAFLAYAMFGNLIPGLFAHRGYGIPRIIAQLTMSTEGLWGMALGVSASFVYLFILFGSLMDATGGGDFLINISMSLVGRVRGGIAKVAVVASALFGTISGTGTGNVVATGSITIPMMIRQGYKPHVAGAIECVASTGGPMLPPMMAAAAFLIPEFIGSTYREVIIAALIPALLFFWTVFWMLDFHAARNGKVGLPANQCPKASKVLKEGWHFVVVLLIIIYMLVIRRSTPTFSAMTGITAMLALSLVVPVAGVKRIPKTYLDALHSAAMNARMVIAACAVAGIVLAVVSLTGLGLAFSSRVALIAGDSLFRLLAITTVATIFLGMGIPATPAYIIVAITIAPAMVRMGVEPMTAHLFVFWFGMMAIITPPICTAVYASVGISKARILPTAIESLKLGGIGFVIPYVFVYRPALLMRGSVSEILFTVVTFAIGAVAFGAATQGYLLLKLTTVKRMVFLVAGAALIFPSIPVTIVGYVFLAVGLLLVVLEARQQRRGLGSVVAA
ncbi:MAG: TRAP transporter fused permease subunit [Spirochaetaceae bacterium]|nr:MAG: TRAP transporter fused permease subunit [Spirochaetaceae bacterium]